MGFISWHYSFGVNFYLTRYLGAITSVSHYFSLPLLLPTLFSPWKRVIIVEKRNPTDIMGYLNVLSFNLVSRAVGAVVRIILFIVGLLVLFLITIFGGLGMILWVAVPFLSLGVYFTWLNNPERVSKKLVKKMHDDPTNAIEVMLNSDPGQFMVRHLGVRGDIISSNSNLNVDSIPENVSSFSNIVNELVNADTWNEGFLVDNQLTREDILIAAKWWDQINFQKTNLDEHNITSSAGIGRELLFGYTPNLDKYGSELNQFLDFSHHLIGRKGIVQRIERTLTSGNNVVLIGQPGVGKKTVLLEFAKRAKLGELGLEMSHRRIIEADLNFLGAEAVDLNQKKSNLDQILAEASYAGNVILVVRDLHRYTNSAVEGFDFTDILEKYLERRVLKLVAISTNIDYERFLAQNSRLRKYFDTVEVEEPTQAESMAIIVEAATDWESKQNMIFTVPALRKIIKESDQYVSDTPFPEKAIEALDAIVNYIVQTGVSNVVRGEIVDTVMSERTGVPLAKLTESQTAKLANLEDVIHERLVDQKEAVSLIAKILRAKSVGVISTSRPLGSFLFLGPTGVGKTETAKVLAKTYFGSEENIIRFDMAEYVGREGLERLIGSQAADMPGVLTNAIKNHPASLLLLDEIEKAPPQIYNLFLAMLDEGKITDAFGNVINCQNLFIVATSNAGANFIREIVNSGNLDELHKRVVDHVMHEGQFSPEFINRFDGVVVYKPLTKNALLSISELLLSDLSKNLKAKNIKVEFSPESVEKLSEDGYEPEFGARPMRRLIDIELGDLLGRAILSGQVQSGDSIKIFPGKGKGNFRFEKQ